MDSWLAGDSPVLVSSLDKSPSRQLAQTEIPVSEKTVSRDLELDLPLATELT